MRHITMLLIMINLLLASNLPTNSIVKLSSSLPMFDYKYPWQTSKVVNYVGSGAIIENNRILTSAHVVSGAKFIEVQKENDPKRYVGHVKFISNQLDLAIVEVDDLVFFNGTNPLKLNSHVKPRDEITVLGYPVGGKTISTTTGVISRIENTRYIWGGKSILAIQVDAAINSGNSGGPAIDKNGDVVGIAMMRLQNADNISYIVPSVMINTFFNDIKDGKVDGFEDDEIIARQILNENMKKYFGLTSDTGVLITKVAYGVKDFQENDILLEIDGHPIANDGTISSEFGRINGTFLLQVKQIGQTSTFKVLRNKQIVSFSHIITKVKPLIITEFATEPRYIIYGGLVFTPVTYNYLGAITDKANAINMLFYNKGKSAELDEPVVWMQHIFPLNVNREYYSRAHVVDSVNGIKVKNFNHFVKLIDELSTEFVIIEMIEKIKVILNVKEAKESFKELQKTYYLNTDRNIKEDSKLKEKRVKIIFRS